MARPFMPRVYYRADDPSVHLDDESMEMILVVYRRKKLSYGKLSKIADITPDVARHFVTGHHIRLSQLKKVVTALGMKVLYEQIG